MKKSMKTITAAALMGSLLSASAMAADHPYYIDEDSIRTFGPGCDSNDQIFINIEDGAANIIFANLQTCNN